jgi:hypothetical protein
MLLSQGRDFGPALKSFDAAPGFEKRMKCMLDVLRAKTEYETEIQAALADELSGKIEQITKNLSGVPDRMLSTEQINLNRRMNETVTKLFEDIGLLHKQTKQCAKFAAGAVKTLKAKDSWLGTTETAGGVGTKGAAIYALANCCLACADHGKQLISLLPV